MVSLPIYGGQPYERQFRALIAAYRWWSARRDACSTHLDRETLDLSSVRFAVLDEADEMLDMGFIEDIEAILSRAAEGAPDALFSATIPPRIARLAERYLHDPARISVAAREAVAPRVRQVYYEVPYQAKYEALARILDLETPESAIVFVNTRRDAETVSEQLSGLGYRGAGDPRRGHPGAARARARTLPRRAHAGAGGDRCGRARAGYP